MIRERWSLTQTVCGSCPTLCPTAGSCPTLCPTAGSCPTHCPTAGSCPTHCPTAGSCPTHCPTAGSCPVHCRPQSHALSHTLQALSHTLSHRRLLSHTLQAPVPRTVPHSGGSCPTHCRVLSHTLLSHTLQAPVLSHTLQAPVPHTAVSCPAVVAPVPHTVPHSAGSCPTHSCPTQCRLLSCPTQCSPGERPVDLWRRETCGPVEVRDLWTCGGERPVDLWRRETCGPVEVRDLWTCGSERPVDLWRRETCGPVEVRDLWTCGGERPVDLWSERPVDLWRRETCGETCRTLTEMARVRCLLLLLLLLLGLTHCAEQTSAPGHSHTNGSVAVSSSQSTHFLIVVMEEDGSVLQSALHLFDKHSSASALLVLHKNTFEVIRGSLSSSAVQYELSLVGHGPSPSCPTGSALLSGHTAAQLVHLLRTFLSTLGLNRFSRMTVVSCNLGQHSEFTSQLLHSLRSLHVRTTVTFFLCPVSVSPAGDILTETDGVWTSHDLTRRVTAELKPTETLWRRAEQGCSGPPDTGYKGPVLFSQTVDWPTLPQMFVPKALRKKYVCMDCLEGLTWSLFFEESEKRRAPDFVPQQEQKNMTAVWLTSLTQDTMVFKHFSTIQDLLVEIRYSAREELSSKLLYVLNDCVYKVHWSNLSVSLVGKFFHPDTAGEKEQFLQSFSDEPGSIQSLQQGLKASRFHEFCRQTFQFNNCNYNCELWGQYFMAAVFSVSVMNFRVFSLFLMSVISCEVGLAHGVNSHVCTSFVGDVHPMMSRLPWPRRPRRGFYGGTLAEFEQAPQEQQLWLEQVVAKENALYVQAKQMMSVVDPDQQTELEIFGRVKVMNKYVFSSYLEYFRGTPEGKNLKTGCSSTIPGSVPP
ncbi:hypothetical protein WMY93_019116 [Mugilogobius chulae]|uniref:Peptidase C80 domain-containing protein n=1 Tax=Mugilogobius chulae TaxID=88201 RepID=A0AAW0NG77_9GOBI